MKNSNSSRDAPSRRGTPWRRLMPAMAACMGLIQPIHAMDPNRAMSQYVHDRWATEQGFPKGPVYAITQTPDGYLWIGTEAGLVRFDGWNFRLIKDDSGAFTIASVLGLTSDDSGCLWMRLQDMTIVRYCGGKFDRPTADQQLYRRVEAMARSDRGQVLVWEGAGRGAYGFRAGTFEKLASTADLPQSPVTSLAQTRNGDLWMGTRDAGLFRKAGGQTLSIKNGLPDLKIDCLLSDGDRSLWVGTDDGIVRWDGKEIAAPDMPGSLRHFQALAIVGDHDGNVWVGTDSRGLLRLNSGGVTTFHIGEAALPQAVTALFEDREGELWIGHADGIERLRDSAFVTYSTPEGLPAGGSNPVYVDSENRIWFPPVTGGLWWAKGEQHGRVNGDGLDKDVVK